MSPVIVGKRTAFGGTAGRLCGFGSATCCETRAALQRSSRNALRNGGVNVSEVAPNAPCDYTREANGNSVANLPREVNTDHWFSRRNEFELPWKGLQKRSFPYGNS